MDFNKFCSVLSELSDAQANARIKQISEEKLNSFVADILSERKVGQYLEEGNEFSKLWSLAGPLFEHGLTEIPIRSLQEEWPRACSRLKLVKYPGVETDYAVVFGREYNSGDLEEVYTGSGDSFPEAICRAIVLLTWRGLF
jgi:hypothetical protein